MNRRKRSHRQPSYHRTKHQVERLKLVATITALFGTACQVGHAHEFAKVPWHHRLHRPLSDELQSLSNRLTAELAPLLAQAGVTWDQVVGPFLEPPE